MRPWSSFSKARRSAIRALVLDELSKVLNLFISGVMRDAEIELRALASNTSARADGDARISLGMRVVLSEYACG
jgi:hypothetical protein